mmetsp:Transcript_17055/g.53618  ORF Transcript_17055/g.53618 Transcript_17055/m.53618 type:complete len:351 (+) Transcript_17055:279-1331(+)
MRTLRHACLHACDCVCVSLSLRLCTAGEEPAVGRTPSGHPSPHLHGEVLAPAGGIVLHLPRVAGCAFGRSQQACGQSHPVPCGAEAGVRASLWQPPRCRDASPPRQRRLAQVPGLSCIRGQGVLHIWKIPIHRKAAATLEHQLHRPLAALERLEQLVGVGPQAVHLDDVVAKPHLGLPTCRRIPLLDPAVVGEREDLHRVLREAHVDAQLALGLDAHVKLVKPPDGQSHTGGSSDPLHEFLGRALLAIHSNDEVAYRDAALRVCFPPASHRPGLDAADAKPPATLMVLRNLEAELLIRVVPLNVNLEVPARRREAPREPAGGGGLLASRAAGRCQRGETRRDGLLAAVAA